MLDAAVVERMNEVFGGQKCNVCRSPAERLRSGPCGDQYFCQACYCDSEQEIDLPIYHEPPGFERFSFEAEDEPDNMPDQDHDDYTWFPGMIRRKRRLDKHGKDGKMTGSLTLEARHETPCIPHDTRRVLRRNHQGRRQTTSTNESDIPVQDQNQGQIHHPNPHPGTRHRSRQG